MLRDRERAPAVPKKAVGHLQVPGRSVTKLCVSAYFLLGRTGSLH